MLQVVHSFFQHACKPVFFIVGWDDDGHEQLGWFNIEGFAATLCGLQGIEPARERLWLCNGSVFREGRVLFFLW
jgi:hypothetical protein